MSNTSPFAVLRNRDFRIYWMGQAVSLVGTWMQVMAQSWVVTSRTGSAAALGTLNIIASLPMLALGMKAGEIADRVDKRRLLMATQVALMVLAFAISAVLYSGMLELWMVYAFAVLAGVVTAFEMPASQAFAPELVSGPDIPRAVGLMQAIFHGSRLFGPALAGICIERFGEGSAFAANGLSFVAVLISLAMVKPRAPATSRNRGAGGFREGVAFVKQDPTMRALIAVLGLTMVFVFPYMVVMMPYYARHVLDVQASAMGTIMSGSGFGALAGAGVIVLMGGIAWRTRLMVGVTGMSFALAALGAMPIVLGVKGDASIPWAFGLVAALSFNSSMTLGTVMQTAQQLVPGELRGRVMALFGIAFTGILPFSALALSGLVDQFAMPPIMIVSGTCYLLATLALLMRTPRVAPTAEASPA